MKPISGLYYIKENKGRSLILISMLMLTVFMFLAGNYVKSPFWFWEKGEEYADKILLVEAITTDEEYRDYRSVVADLKADEKLTVLERSSYGYGGLSWMCTLGFEMGSQSFVFTTVEDMKTAFRRLGIEADLSNVKDGSVVISKALARNRGLKIGDTIDSTVDKWIDGSYTVDALIDDDCFATFYVSDDGADHNYRIYVMSDELSGYELRDYVRQYVSGKKVKMEGDLREEIASESQAFILIFITAIILISIILSVTVNAVITGHYVKRTFEFGVYRAIGMRKRDMYRKCASEILILDAIAIAAGAVLTLLLTFLLNELKYLPEGKYLPYFSWLGVIGFLISNLMVVIPTILLKGRKMSKADVTEF